MKFNFLWENSQFSAKEAKNRAVCSVDEFGAIISDDLEQVVVTELSENPVNCVVGLMTDLTIEEIDRKDDLLAKIQKSLRIMFDGEIDGRYMIKNYSRNKEIIGIAKSVK